MDSACISLLSGSHAHFTCATVRSSLFSWRLTHVISTASAPPRHTLIMTQTRVHCETFVQFEVTSKNTQVIQLFEVFLLRIPIGQRFTMWIVQATSTVLTSTVFLQAVEAHREDGKDATSHHFIRSKQSTKGQPKIVIHHSSSPTSTQKSSSRFDLRVRP